VSLSPTSGHPASAVSLTECTVERIEASTLKQALDSGPKLVTIFVERELDKVRRLFDGLIDFHFHSTEVRLARALLRMTRVDVSNSSFWSLPPIRQGRIAEMIGTTRSRVNYFMNKFRRLGFIDYDRSGRIRARRSLSQVL
jgi:CRP-like cAMP-binding protein